MSTLPNGSPLAFQRLWENDPYAVRRTGALAWLGDRYLLAQPINKSKPKTNNRKLEYA